MTRTATEKRESAEIKLVLSGEMESTSAIPLLISLTDFAKQKEALDVGRGNVLSCRLIKLILP